MWFAQNARSGVSFPTYITKFEYNANIDYEHPSSSVNFLHNQIVVDTFGVVNIHNTPSEIANVRGARIDGYHVDQSGFQYFGFDADITLNGIDYSKNDIIRCNNNDCTNTGLVFFALYQQPYNVDAFSIDSDNGDILFSIDVEADILPGGLKVTPATVVRYHQGTYTEEFIAPSTVKNIDSLSYLPNNIFVYSWDRAANDRELFYLYNPLDDVHLQIYDPGLADNVDTTSLMVYENDLIFKHGFE